MIPLNVIADALEICLSHENFLQGDGTTQGLHMSCSYATISMAKYASLANKFHLRPRVWEKFIDDEIVLLEHGITSLPSY